MLFQILVFLCMLCPYLVFFLYMLFHLVQVVKVQHGDVDRLMRDDMTALTRIVHAIRWLDPSFDFRPVIDEWAAESIKELDFRHEASNMARVAANLKAAGAIKEAFLFSHSISLSSFYFF